MPTGAHTPVSNSSPFDEKMELQLGFEGIWTQGNWPENGKIVRQEERLDEMEKSTSQARDEPVYVFPVQQRYNGPPLGCFLTDYDNQHFLKEWNVKHEYVPKEDLLDWLTLADLGSLRLRTQEQLSP